MFSQEIHAALKDAEAIKSALATVRTSMGSHSVKELNATSAFIANLEQDALTKIEAAHESLRALRNHVKDTQAVEEAQIATLLDALEAAWTASATSRFAHEHLRIALSRRSI